MAHCQRSASEDDCVTSVSQTRIAVVMDHWDCGLSVAMSMVVKFLSLLEGQISLRGVLVLFDVHLELVGVCLGG